MTELQQDQGSNADRLAALRILAVNEEELQRIVLDIHDGPVQQIFAAYSQIQLMQKRRAAGDPIEAEQWDRHLSRTGKLLEEALNQIRDFLGSFRSPDFLERDLAEIIENVVLQFESFTECEVGLDLTEREINVSTPVKIAFYRTCQEALFNSYRHSGVSQQEVRLTTEEQTVVLQVSDRGKGFVPPEVVGPTATERGEHIGLRGMRDRVGLVNGEFKLHSAPNEGTQIVVRIPLT